MDEPMTAEEWALHLKRKAQRTGLTAEELQLWLSINCNDRLVEIQVRIEELAGRYQQLDEWMEATVPGYRPGRGQPALPRREAS